MHLAFVRTRSQSGLSALPVTVEIHMSSGLPAFQVVGVSDAASREIRSRVRSAIVSSHLKWPDYNIAVNLAPTDHPKQGAGFDLPIAIGLLLASGQLPSEAAKDREFLGELGLDGAIRPARGALAATLATTTDQRDLCVAREGAPQLAAVTDSRIIAATDLLTLCAALKEPEPALTRAAHIPMTQPSYPDLSQIRGQSSLSRALELAAAGGHHLLMTGPPGVGKTLSASVLAGLLPPLDPATQEELWLLRDLAGLPPTHHPEFRAPHHSSSIAALIGGTARATPGEISMAHGGVLFLDELTEFPRAVLNQLRQPLESGEICVSRAEHQHRYPARFQLVAAMNPCPCGFAGSDDQHCHCTPDRIWRYRQGVSGPLLDRIDLHITLSKPASSQLLSHRQEQDASNPVRERVAHARFTQQARQGCPNRDLAGDGLLDACALSSATRTWFSEVLEKMKLSVRSAHRRLRVARTIADMNESGGVTREHIYAALSYREMPDGAAGTRY